MANRIQVEIFRKNYEALGKLVDGKSTSIVSSIAKSRYNIYSSAYGQQFNEVIHNEYEHLKQLYSYNLPPMVSDIYMNSMKMFMFEVMSQGSNVIEQSSILKDLGRMQPPSMYASNPGIIKSILSSLYLSVSYFQLQIKRLVEGKRSTWGSELKILLEYLVEMHRLHEESYQICRKGCMILMHMAIHCYKSSGSDSLNVVHQLLVLVQKYYLGKKYIENDCLVVMVYSCVKILLGMKTIPHRVVELITHLLAHFDMTYSDIYDQNILKLFFIIKILIFTKPQSVRVSHKHSEQIQQVPTDPQSIYNAKNNFLSEKLSIFLNVNLDTLVVKLDEIAQNVIRHQVASLATLICFKLGINKFSKYFIELMHDSPFNNDIQTIKLCFELFDAREFNKLQHLFQIVLSAPSCKHLKEREVLLAMCGIFTGLYLQNHQEGLLYAKLNHQQSKKEILKNETLLQHLGFAYYNLAINEPYVNPRQVYLTQALHAFQRSYQINSNNYLLSYCMGKISLVLYDYESAYKYAAECCMSGRGIWIPFSLLACVCMCQRRVGKASIIIDELLKKYEDVGVIYYMKSYIEVNKILMEVECDEELESARILGEQIYEKYREKILKSKSIQTVLVNCQHYHQLMVSHQLTPPDENYFYHLGVDGSSSTTGEKAILDIIGLLIELDQYLLIQILLNNLPKSSIVSYYKALLHQKKQQFEEAKKQYHQALMQQPYHTNSLINLAMLQIDTKLEKATHYIAVAQKFTDDGKVCLGKGLVLSKRGEISQSHEELLKDRWTAWSKHLPDLIYYY